MRRWIVHIDPLSLSSGVEFLVGGDQRQPAQTMDCAFSMQIDRRRELDGVVGPQLMSFRQSFRVGEQCGRHFHDRVLVSGIEAELGQKR